MARTATGRRPIVWISAIVSFVLVIIVVFVVSLGAGGTSTNSRSSTMSTSSTTTVAATCAGSSTSQTITIITGPVLVGATGKVAAGVVCPDGHLGTILYYTYGQPISIAVTVPNSLTPISIQTVLDGNPQYSVSPWDVNSTGRIYVLNFGGAGQGPLTLGGLHDVYAIVKFSDNSTATSNVVYFTVNVPAR
jgi:hypothetical protein